MSRSDRPLARTRVTARGRMRPGVVLLCLALGGCGFGTAAVVSSSSSGSATNAAPAISAFHVTDPKRSPCTIRFVLSDAESDPATVEFLYQAPGMPQPESMTQLAGAPGNPVEQLPTTAQGVTYAILWRFKDEASLPADASLTHDVLVFARAQGAPDVIVNGANAQTLDLGNDAPVLSVDDPPADVSGIVPVRLHMLDSSSDALDIRVEFDILGDVPDTGWSLAMPAGLLPGTPPPAYAFVGVTADSQGSDLVFFWDTDVDLHQLERDVRLRITPIDPVVAGSSAITSVFNVDNNAAPIVQLHEGAFLTNTDSVRGILVPCTVIDEESDEITLVFQWRREGEDGFFDSHPLPSTPAGIEALLASESLRREFHVCSPYPRRFEGRPVWIDSTHVRLPELWGQDSILVTPDMVGRELEILRPPMKLAPVSGPWHPNMLVHPLADLPLDGGTKALVLDENSIGNWRLVELRLLDGVIESMIAHGSGSPGALCFEGGEASVLVASALGNAWLVDRITLADGAKTHLADYTDGNVEQGLPRGIASLGTHAAVLTVGSSLVHLDWSTSPGVAIAVRTDLARPWGVVVDPRNAGCVLLAENNATESSAPGRIVALDLATHALAPVVILPDAADGLAFPRPRGIATLRKGARLLALCETDPLTGRVELRSVDLGRADTSPAVSLGQVLGTSPAALAAGATDDLLVSTSAADRLVHVAGGVERRGTIADFDCATATVTLASAFTPELDPSSRWRVTLSDGTPFRVTSSPAGVPHDFLWDSSDVPGGGGALLKVTPMDTDIGTVVSSTGPKQVSPAFEPAPLALTGSFGATGYDDADVVQADLDGDGDLDLVGAGIDGNTLAVFWQTAPGVFNPAPTTLGDASTTPHPSCVQAADLNGDGRLDLVGANYGGDNLTIFWQTSTGVFSPTPTPLGDASTTPGAFWVEPADLDGDGDLDLVCANRDGSNLRVFWQTGSGVFNLDPTPLGDASTTLGPASVQAADLDGDGDLDLVCANRYGSNLTIFWQTGPGVFSPQPTTLGDASTTNVPLSVQTVDLDGDGDLDLVSANAQSKTVTVFWQTAPGVFDPTPTTVGGPSIPSAILYVQAADLDGDGDLDLVCPIGNNNILAVFWQVAPGTFDPLPTFVGGSSTTVFPRSIRAADIDGDGSLDLVSANTGWPSSTDAGLTVFWHAAAGTIDPTPTTVVIGNPAAFAPASVQAADLDGDGNLDLVSANQIAFGIYGSDLTVFWQTGQGTFDPTPTSVGGPSITDAPRSVQAADLDGDCDLDLVCANFSSDELTVFWQSSTGTFEPTPTHVGDASTTNGPVFVLAVDLDGDGDLDLVSANNTGNNLRVFRQAAPHTFDANPTPLGGVGITDAPTSVQAADIDGDGLLDLVSANSGNDTLTVFWQTSPGTFDPVPTIVGGTSTTHGPDFVLAVDLDGDGDLDLVSANGAGNDLRVFWQTAPRTFDANPTPLGGVGITDTPTCVQAVDLDGDGDLDLVSANSVGNNLTVFWQTAPGTFDPTPTRLGGPGITDKPVFVQVADLNGDGDLDLVSANFAGGTLTIFWRRH